ncbi:MAG: 3-hydroxybutyryl-CoA dehydrogenase [Hydrogenibacillus schlegelii]|uniref:3-hydroxybutyryl-CoA dehydrogenase n=1 Tax=Hydrogenibacillus schlegelii TaxID=1484 RepID=A0A947CWE6_HYDSH|nr:3-hydroxybutyryl-CoA dehydrogenase [Hydrogenibacillus schlegelii]
MNEQGAHHRQEGAVVGVVGAGTMGSGIALVCALAGYSVRLFDANAEMLQKARQSMRKTLERQAQKGKLDAAEIDSVAGRIAYVESDEAFGEAAYVIEAVFEDLAVKREVFRRLEEKTPVEALFLTNTSSLSVTEIAHGMKRPERVAGLHFFNPPVVMPLVEVVKGEQTSEQTLHQTVAFARSLGKEPVVSSDTPGFIVNRVARPFYNEALRIVESGVARPEQVDRVLKASGAFKMGPFELQDLIGIDVNFATTSSVFEQFFYEPRFRPSRLQRNMVRSGKLGRKAGKGFYDYES